MSRKKERPWLGFDWVSKNHNQTIIAMISDRKDTKKNEEFQREILQLGLQHLWNLNVTNIFRPTHDLTSFRDILIL